jgi:hypothetical protein
MGRALTGIKAVYRARLKPLSQRKLIGFFNQRLNVFKFSQVGNFRDMGNLLAVGNNLAAPPFPNELLYSLSGSKML